MHAIVLCVPKGLNGAHDYDVSLLLGKLREETISNIDLYTPFFDNVSQKNILQYIYIS